MKAKINKDGELVLTTKSYKELELVYGWAKGNHGRIIMPDFTKKRHEDMRVLFSDITISIVL